MSRIAGRRQQGTTLIELLVTVVFLSVCAVPMLTVISSSQVRANKASARTIALSLAQNTLDLARTVAKSGTITTGTTTSDVAVTGLPYTAKLTSKVALKARYTNLYRIAVEVEYDDAGAKVKLETLVRATNE